MERESKFLPKTISFIWLAEMTAEPLQAATRDKLPLTAVEAKVGAIMLDAICDARIKNSSLDRPAYRQEIIGT